MPFKPRNPSLPAGTNRFRRPGGALIAGLRVFVWAAVLVTLVVGCSLTWQSSGNIGAVGWLPHRITSWMDAHGVFRNFPAFLLLSLPVFVLLSTERSRQQAAWGLALFAEAIEYPQLAMPTRHFDWRDIAWSLAGVGCAWVGVVLATRLFNALKSTTGDCRSHSVRQCSALKP